MTILHGLEVDILPDGSLDCPDAVLASLDIVLASLHDSAGQDGRRLTRALPERDPPSARVRDHPSRQPARRPPGRATTWTTPRSTRPPPRPARRSRSTARPSHLDLNGERAREAVQAGVTVVIDSDCHRAPRARSADAHGRRRPPAAAGCEPQHVLNTRSARRRPRLHRPQTRHGSAAVARNCTAVPSPRLRRGRPTAGCYTRKCPPVYPSGIAHDSIAAARPAPDAAGRRRRPGAPVRDRDRARAAAEVRPASRTSPPTSRTPTKAAS